MFYIISLLLYTILYIYIQYTCIHIINAYIIYIIRIYIHIYIIHIYIYIYGKCMGFARTRNDDRRRILIIIIITIIISIKPLLKIFNECRSLTGVGDLNPY